MPTRRVASSGRGYYSNRPGRVAPPRRPWLSSDRVKGGAKLGLLLIGLVLIYRYFDVHQINVVGVDPSSVSALQQAARASLKQHWFEGNLLTLRPGTLSDDIMTVQYRVKDVSVKRVWPHGLKLVITARQPSINWQTGGVAYLLDIDGSVLGPSGNKALPTVIDGANLPVKVGDRVVPTAFIQFVDRLTGEIKPQTGLVVSGISVPATTTELDVITTKNFVVKFDTTSGVEQQLTELNSVLATLSSLKKQPAQYIDLRIPGKAFYR